MKLGWDIAVFMGAVLSWKSLEDLSSVTAVKNICEMKLGWNLTFNNLIKKLHTVNAVCFNTLKIKQKKDMLAWRWFIWKNTKYSHMSHLVCKKRSRVVHQITHGIAKFYANIRSEYYDAVFSAAWGGDEAAPGSVSGAGHLAWGAG